VAGAPEAIADGENGWLVEPTDVDAFGDRLLRLAADPDLADDPSWLLVSVLSAEVSVEEAEASGVLPPPGSVDRALMQLDGAERVELAKILREELAAKTPVAPQGPGA